jgi:hypothetical protein
VTVTTLVGAYDDPPDARRGLYARLRLAIEAARNLR